MYSVVFHCFIHATRIVHLSLYTELMGRWNITVIYFIRPNKKNGFNFVIIVIKVFSAYLFGQIDQAAVGLCCDHSLCKNPHKVLGILDKSIKNKSQDIYKENFPKMPKFSESTVFVLFVSAAMVCKGLCGLTILFACCVTHCGSTPGFDFFQIWSH